MCRYQQSSEVAELHVLNILYLITVIIELFSGVLERLPPGLLKVVETLI